MTGTPTLYTGEDAAVRISGLTHSTLAISDFGLTISADTAEQELIGEKGNFMVKGAVSVEGSLTSCKLHNTAVGKLIANMVDGEHISISGNCGTNSLHWYFASAMVTGFDFSLGTASDIAEGTLDYSILYPYKVSGVETINGYSYITDTGISTP